MATDRTGTVAPFVDAKGKKYYRARIRLGDGSRKWLRVPATKAYSEERAQLWAASQQEGEDRDGLWLKKKLKKQGAATPGETVADYADRWLVRREARGHTSVSDDRSRLKTHILSLIGPKPIAKVSKAEVEAVRDALDMKIQQKELSWKTALNCWAVLSKLFADAANSKDKTLRVREDNPAMGVLPTDRGADKSKPFLYPNELAQFIECEAVPLAWRELVALATYLGLRAGELEALRWEDVDIERGIINVHRSIDRQRDKVKETKSRKPRRFAIEPALLPLLKRMQEDAGGDSVVEMPRVRDLAEKLRDHLKLAGIKRRELFADDETQKQLVFHDLRSTACTWWSIRGDDALKIQSRAGHSSFATTQRYLRQAEVLRDGFGEVFPPLTVLVHRTPLAQRVGQNPANYMMFWRGGRDSKTTRRRARAILPRIQILHRLTSHSP